MLKTSANVCRKKNIFYNYYFEQREDNVATLKDVAERVGVSASTVSRVLSGRVPVSDEIKKKVLAVVEELDYHPNLLAQGLKGASTKTIGLIIPNVRSLVFPAAVRAIEDTANRSGYTVILCNTDDDQEKEKVYIDSLRRRLVDGFIFCTARPGYTHLMQLQQEGFPAVFLIRSLDDQENSIVIDNYLAGYDATKYLLSRGVKNIALINGSMTLPLYRDRYQGYCRAMTDSGQTIRHELIVDGISGWEDGHEAMAAMLKKGFRPEGVLATNDPKAIGAIRAIQDFGLQVPRDISVIGIDNSDFAQLIAPPLTTISQPFYEMGVEACRRLIRMIKGDSYDQARKIFKGELVIRKSVI